VESVCFLFCLYFVIGNEVEFCEAKLPITVENISSNRFETKNLKLRIMLNKSNNLNKPHNSVITYILCYAPFNYGHKFK
jgi:hypothetical protein